MENILTKIKHRMNVDPKPYYNRLSWKIVVPRLLYKLAVALVNLAFYIFKAFLATVLSVIIMERIINDRAPFELIVSLFYTLLGLIFLKPILKYIFNINIISEYRIEIVSLGYFDKNGKPFYKTHYRLIRVHDYGYVWNKFAEIADIFDPITYHLYDSEGNRVTNAILDRKNWRSASILENEEEFK